MQHRPASRNPRRVNGYRIIVRGRLSERFAAVFDGLQVESLPGATAISGPIADQGQLHGVLERIRDFGLELVRVEQIEQVDP
jgi:hypothetical protein